MAHRSPRLAVDFRFKKYLNSSLAAELDAPAARVLVLALGLLLVPAAVGAAEAPVVDSLVASPAAVAPGGTVTLAVEAHDPDCPDACTSGCGMYLRADLTRWEADGGAFTAEDDGVSASPYSATASWQAPMEEATYTLTVFLSDSGSFFCGGRQSTSASVTVLVTATTNRPPAIESLTASPAQLFPGGTSALACDATDPEGDPVAYSWDADTGTVTAGDGGAAVFTAGEPAIATVTCTATDPAGAFVEETVELSVTGAVAEGYLDSALASPQRLAVDEMGDVYVADRRAGGIAVLHLGSGELVYRLPVPAVSSVAIDWEGRLLVGTAAGAAVVGRAGEPVLALGSGQVSDVAVDRDHRRFGVLYGRLGRAVIYGETGAAVAILGASGELKSPRGLAVTPAGEWVVGDTGHGQIRIFDAAGSLARSFGAAGGGAGEFVQLDDVAVDGAGLIYASDSFQDWVQVWNADGTLREILGTYGAGRGELQTAAGVAPADAFGRLLAASLNGSRIEVFRTREEGGAVPAPVAVLSSSELTFLPQAVATASPPQTVALTNGGEAPLGVRAAAVRGDFAQSNDCGLFLDPGAACTFSLTASPAAAGPFTGLLEIDTSTGALEVDLAGSGFVPPGVALAPGRLDFSDQELGTASPPKAVVLTNPGSEPLLLSAVGVTGGYLQANACGAAIAGGGLCVIQVVFVPDRVDDHLLGTLTVVSNAAGSPHAVALDGRGIPGPIDLWADDLEIAEGDGPAGFTLRLSGPAAAPVTVDYATRAGTAVAGEDFEPVSGSVTIPPGDLLATVAVPIVDDEILEPDEETFHLELSNAVHATLADPLAVAAVLDDELCLGPNLLANPGAEERSAAGVPGWTALAGDWQRRLADPDPPAGVACFAGRGSALPGTAELRQDVDVSAYAAAIDGGGQLFAWDGWAASAGGASGRIVVEYRDRDNEAVLGASASETVTGAWRQVSGLGPAPAGTRWIRLRLAVDGSEAFFDALTLGSLRAATLSVEDAVAYEGDSGVSETIFTVRLACPFHQEVRGRLATADGTAVAGEDYLAADEAVVLEPGATAWEVPVEVLGDEIDEGHELFFGDFELEDGEPVLWDPRGAGVIVNDDFCARGAGYWKTHPGLWPLDSLVLGGVEYHETALRWLLEYRGPDAAARLARQLVAALLNLEAGSEPSAWPVVDSAQVFLAVWPPGSDPRGDDRREADRLKDLLEVYNAGDCGGKE